MRPLFILLALVFSYINAIKEGPVGSLEFWVVFIFMNFVLNVIIYIHKAKK